MRYIKASLLLVGFLLVQSTTAMAQCPIKEQIMNGDDEGEGLERKDVRGRRHLSATH